MVFFFYGPNTYASRRKLRDMVAAYKQKTGSDIGYERLDGETVTLAALTAALKSVPFLTSSRLVVVERLSANKVVAEGALKLLTDIPESTVAVFYEGEVDQRTSYFKAMLKGCKAFKFESLSGPALSKWVDAQVASAGGTIDPAAKRLLIDMVGDDQWRLEQEIIKLVNYRKQVSSDTVKAMVAAGANQTIFDLVDAMTAGRLKQALASYRALLAERANEMYILTMITWQLRNLLLAKVAGQITSTQLAKAAGMSPYVAGKALDRRRDYPEEALRQAFLAAVETDYAIKSGEGTPAWLVERLIYRVATKEYINVEGR
jgi:DNA polymerase III subunit delta